MKFLLFLTSILFLASCSYDNQIAESFGGSEFDECYDIDLTLEGDIIITGIFTKKFTYRGKKLLKSKGGYDIFVCKMDTSGKIKWANSVGKKGKDWAYNSTQDEKGNTYTCGYTKINKHHFPLVFKMDKNGNQLWKKVLPTKGEFTNLIATKGNIFITASNQKNSLYQMSINGELTVLYQDSSFNGRGIFQNDKNKIIAYGSRNQQASIVCFNQQLQKTHEVSFGTKGNDIILSMIKSKNHFHLCGQIEGDTLFCKKDTTTEKTPLISKGGKDGFYAMLDSTFNIVHFEIQTSPKNDWSRNLAYGPLGEILLSTIINNDGNINGNPLQNQKGNFDIALSTIKNKKIISTKLISGSKEEGVNKIIVQDSLLYFSGWHQGNLKISEKIELQDNGNGNAFLIKINKSDIFKN